MAISYRMNWPVFVWRHSRSFCGKRCLLIPAECWIWAAASPSMWFPGFVDYMKENTIQCSNIYLSLGDKEEKTRNVVMAKVGDCIRDMHGWLKEQGINCILEWNAGGHFREPELRTARSFAWLLEQLPFTA